jgi:mycothiol synthase
MNGQVVDAAAPQISVSGRLSPDEVREVEGVLQVATDADGVQPLSEHVWLHLRHGGEGPDVNLRLRVGAVLAGYAHLDPTDPVAGPSAEVVVHPAYRGRGYGRLLVQAALDAAPGHQLRLWSHGDHPAARALARSMGFSEVRRLEQWRRSLRTPLPEATLPPGIRLRTFRPGSDDGAWLTLNAAAFDSHPEQGSLTLADLHARMAEAWFDPNGFLLAEEDTPDVGSRLVGFHWTKVHGGDQHADHAHEAIGEVYVVGVDPSHRGKGLGRTLTVAGLRYLRDLGLGEAMLYVESDNERAKALYRGLGFTWWDTDVMFLRGPSTRPGESAGPAPESASTGQ